MKKIMRTWDIVLINVAGIIGLRWIPLAAGYGAASIALWVMAAVLFLVPLGLIATELATAWPEEGGVYVWVKEAYGEKAAFLVSWFYWTNSFFFFPSMLTFIAVTLAFIINPDLAVNKTFVCSTILVGLWVVTVLNFKSMRAFKSLVNLGGILGTIIPGLIIIFLGFAAVTIWHLPIPTDYSWHKWIPDFSHQSNIVFLTALMFSMAGIELTPTLAGETENPKKTFPRALFISVVIIVAVYIIGTVAMSFMIAPDKVGAASGVMDAVKLIGTQLHLPFLVPVVALLMLLSGIGAVSVWAVIPIKMLHESCKHGILPRFFTQLNKNGMPRNALIVQSVIVTIVILATALLPSVNSFYEILVLMTTITYFLPYLALFMAFLKLRKTAPHKVRPYKVPGNKVFPTLVALVGLLSVLTAVFLPFIFPPKDVITAHDILIYRLEILSGPVIFAVVGYWLYARHAKKC